MQLPGQLLLDKAEKHGTGCINGAYMNTLTYMCAFCCLYVERKELREPCQAGRTEAIEGFLLQEAYPYSSKLLHSESLLLSSGMNLKCQCLYAIQCTGNNTRLALTE